GWWGGGGGVGGVGTEQLLGGVVRVGAAVRRAMWIVTRQPGGACPQPDVGRTVPELGLARAVLPQLDSGRDRTVDQARHHGNAGVHAARCRAQDRTRAHARSDQAPTSRHSPERLRASRRAGPVLYLPRLRLLLRP